MSLELQHISPLFICPTPDNPRRAIDQTSPAFLELVESIKAVGILQPLLARPHPDIIGYYDLRAGERRYRAGTAAGLESLPVIVREMDDKTAMEITVLENLQRQDLSPLEEARGIRCLLDTGHPLEVIAAELGKDKGWVARRAKLLTLTKAWLDYAENHPVPAANLEQIARLPDESQKQLFKDITASWNVDKLLFAPGSLTALRERIGKLTHLLSLAAFSITDPLLLPKAGDCTTCPKRSGCQADLFSDDTKGDTCLDPICWDAKIAAHLTREEARLRIEHPNLIKVKGEQAPWDKATDKLLSPYEYKAVKKTTPGAVPALIIAGKGEGTVKFILPDKHSTAAKKAVTKANTTAGKDDPTAAAAALKEKREMLEKRRWCHVANYIRDGLNDGSLPYHPSVDLLQLVALFGTRTDPYFDNPWQEMKRMTLGPVVDAAAWHRVAPKLAERLFIESTSAFSKRHTEAIDGICHLLNLHPKLLFAAATEAIPEPKSWAALEPKATTVPSPDKPAKAARTAPAKPTPNNPGADRPKKPCIICKGTGKIRKLDKAKKAGVQAQCDWCCGAGQVFAHPAPAGLMADRSPEDITVGQPSAEWTPETTKRKPGRPAKKSA